MERRVTPKVICDQLFPEANEPMLGISSKGPNVGIVFTHLSWPRLSIIQYILPENGRKLNSVPLGPAYSGGSFSFSI